MNFQEFLASRDACREATCWIGDKTAEQAWEQCPHAEWMLWLASRIVHKQELAHEIVRAAADIARTTIVHTTDRHVRDCIAAVDRWLAGEQVGLQAAIKAASATYWTINTADDVTLTVVNTARAAWWVGINATWTALEATAAARAAAHISADNHHADIVRKHLPWTLIQPLLERALQEAP